MTRCLLTYDASEGHLGAADERPACVQAQRGTALGKLAKRYLHASALVPDAVFNELVSTRLAQMDVLQFGYVLDGYPHTRAQVDFLTSKGLVPDKVILLPPPDSVGPLPPAPVRSACCG